MGVHCSSCVCIPRGKVKDAIIYKLWFGIKYRTSNKKSPDYKNYGGRGIRMHEEWVNDYSTFENYVLVNLGERPNGHSFDRIDNDGNYEPGNVRWATYSNQIKNRRKPMLREEMSKK